MEKLLTDFSYICWILPYLGKPPTWKKLLCSLCSKTLKTYKTYQPELDYLYTATAWTDHTEEIISAYCQLTDSECSLTTTNSFIVYSNRQDHLDFLTHIVQKAFVVLPQLYRLGIYYMESLDQSHIDCIDTIMQKISHPITKFELNCMGDRQALAKFNKGLKQALPHVVKEVCIFGFCVTSGDLKTIFESACEAKVIKFTDCKLDTENWDIIEFDKSLGYQTEEIFFLHNKIFIPKISSESDIGN
ncbi:unnamed protein product [Moneuplotes crassus]|uniref:Uncharacterized protein n=1 Tax=Euplotes crassus TaxID=5936 RepID=A0AAD1XMK8_EUPCR|nr:unnamed protein product [Moneuplotes crassus]